MCSLAASDVLVTVFSVPFTVLSNLVFMYWPFGPFLCPVISLLQLMVNLLRALTLVAMTCDRYFVITKPFSQRLTLKQAKLVIAGIWSFSFLFSLPVAIFSKIVYLPYEPGSKGLCFEVWSNESLRRVYGIVIMLIQYFIPLLLMFLTFSHIAVIVWTKRTPGEANKKRDERRGRSKKRMLQMLIIIVLNYFLSWLPFHVISIVGDAHPSIYDSMSMHVLWALAHLLSISNSATNAGIYYWRNRTYRVAFQNLWKCSQLIQGR
ncbi:RYamide receptor-like [Saccostrea echinata]|uniref:RYamide receptor-like n=1 Tax=Saccostrea echinata TaxID=191078 RepID=UPI002A7FDB5D|nr:RYamide receptor-like [Saccostrea echinata]